MKKIEINKPGEYLYEVNLSSRGSEENLVVVIKAEESGEYRVNSITNHLMGDSRGRITIKGVVRNGARVYVDGLIKIAKGAENSDSFLAIKLLMLDEKSMAIAEPRLEIENNMVKASHSASVGLVDEEQIRYLLSRGIERNEAEKLIVKGFLEN